MTHNNINPKNKVTYLVSAQDQPPVQSGNTLMYRHINTVRTSRVSLDKVKYESTVGRNSNRVLHFLQDVYKLKVDSLVLGMASQTVHAEGATIGQFTWIGDTDVPEFVFYEEAFADEAHERHFIDLQQHFLEKIIVVTDKPGSVVATVVSSPNESQYDLVKIRRRIENAIRLLGNNEKVILDIANYLQVKID